MSLSEYELRLCHLYIAIILAQGPPVGGFVVWLQRIMRIQRYLYALVAIYLRLFDSVNNRRRIACWQSTTFTNTPVGRRRVSVLCGRSTPIRGSQQISAGGKPALMMANRLLHDVVHVNQPGFHEIAARRISAGYPPVFGCIETGIAHSELLISVRRTYSLSAIRSGGVTAKKYVQVFGFFRVSTATRSCQVGKPVLTRICHQMVDATCRNPSSAAPTGSLFRATALCFLQFFQHRRRHYFARRPAPAHNRTKQ